MERALVTVAMASELTGCQPGTIRAAVRRGDIPLIGTARRVGPYGRPRWLLDAADVVAWRRASRRPDPVPADPLGLALDGSLVVALDRALGLLALQRLERERQALRIERRRVAAARAQLLARR